MAIVVFPRSDCLTKENLQIENVPSSSVQLVALTAADIAKADLAKLLAALKGTGARLIGTVHDEILLEAPEDTAERAVQILQQVGQQYLRRVPIKAEVSIVSTWAEK